MQDAAPGPVNLAVFQFGLEKPDKLPLMAYAEAASLDQLTLSAGDTDALLSGTRLDEVATAELDGITLTPATLSRVHDLDQLSMNAGGSTSGLEPGKHYVAQVKLRDGRRLKAPVNVEPPRPQVTLLNKGTQEEPPDAPSPVHLSSLDDLPVEGRLIFFLKSSVPVNFPRTEKVEVEAVDGSFRTELKLADGSLMLEDAKTAMGTVEMLSRFGRSAFGPVRARVISVDGVAGDWLTLGTLVRLPGFSELRCPRAITKPCTLAGTNLFLASSIGASADLVNATYVPPDFTGTELSVPHPDNGVLYLRLRDDPATVQTLDLPITSSQPALKAAAGQTPVAEAPAAEAPTASPPAGSPTLPAPAPATAASPIKTEP
jgi:hypothetical protein